MRRFLLIAIIVLMALSSYAQTPNCTPGRDLLTVPEIKAKNGKLLGVVMLADEQRTLAGLATSSGSPCNFQQLRFFEGYSLQEPQTPWPHTGDILPGPTLRAHVGDWVEIAFLNQVNPSNFPNTLDQGEQGKTDGCDAAFASRTQDAETRRQIYPRNDTYPNCLHGSSTANLHFHGTHVTPSTTGDNVLQFIHPALRSGSTIEPSTDETLKQFGEIFKQCEAEGTPTKWSQLLPAWTDRQQQLLQKYDSTAPYKGVNGALPESMKLWPRNKARLDDHKWPQYTIGAYPYCYKIPDYASGKVKMGQAPGTHWYHAHKHGSTALNVGNGMEGAFIIEGPYDTSLRDFYKETPTHKNWGLHEQVLVIQQLETALNLLSPKGFDLTGPNPKGPAPLSVNGRLAPVVTMKPNQVQLWRIVNTSSRNFVEFDHFGQHGPGGQSPSWRQIAQDGVQFKYANYERLGTVNAKFNLATGNRADLLVKAPALEGDYALQVVQSISDLPAGTPTTLLTVRVKKDSKPIDPPMDFIAQEGDFPKFPDFLADITGPVHTKHELYFDTEPGSGRTGGKMPLHTINGELFNGHHVDWTMYLNTTEEWKISNGTVNIAHPFHIHVNPFQIIEVFQPNMPSAKDPNSTCYANPTKPSTWVPCTPIRPPYVWWDVFHIPTARQDTLPASVCTVKDSCPADIRDYTTCSSGTCKVTIPGYFKMRSRFVDFTGQFVLHCHILAHEDRGMMQLVQVSEPVPADAEHH
jgi:FtsP/CotA-like multicopper oxidase with cupredoxin domain